MSEGEVYDEEAQRAVEAVCKERELASELERRNAAACSPKPLAWEPWHGGESATLPNGVARLFIEKEGAPPHYFFGIEIEGGKIPLEFGFLEEEDAKKEAQMWLDNFARAIAKHYDLKRDSRTTFATEKRRKNERGNMGRNRPKNKRSF